MGLDPSVLENLYQFMEISYDKPPWTRGISQHLLPWGSKSDPSQHHGVSGCHWVGSLAHGWWGSGFEPGIVQYQRPWFHAGWCGEAQESPDTSLGAWILHPRWWERRSPLYPAIERKGVAEPDHALCASVHDGQAFFDPVETTRRPLTEHTEGWRYSPRPVATWGATWTR